MKRIIAFLLIFSAGILFSQSFTMPKNLLKKAEENHKLLSTDLLMAFKNAELIEKQARNSDAQDAELAAINTQCVYYLRKNEFENLKNKATLLYEKAEQYHNLTYQTIAKIKLFEFYRFNQLYNRAFSELESGREIINKTNGLDSLIINTKANLYNAYSNYYSAKNDDDNQLKYIRLSMNEHQRNPNQQYRKELEFLDFSNLATVYYKINADSAKYYAELSMSKDVGYNRKDVRFNNYMMLGLVDFDKKKYPSALQYFLNAERESSSKSNVDVLELYDKITETYGELHDAANKKKYEAKRDSVKLTVTEVQNKNLHSLLNDKPEEEETENHLWLPVALGIVVVGILILILRKKKRSSHVVELTENLQYSAQDYSTLVEMLKKNDPAFMCYFGKVFPDFNATLLKMNPKLIASDLEFCALLKLKLSTKDIAKYQCIEPQSVRNKKTSIRKKLNIPKECDIYQFVDDL